VLYPSSYPDYRYSEGNFGSVSSVEACPAGQNQLFSPGRESVDSDAGADEQRVEQPGGQDRPPIS